MAALSRGDNPDGTTVITIDDGWHSTYRYALPVLQQLNIPATIFISTYYMQNRIPDTQTLFEYALWCTTATALELTGWPPAARGPWDLADKAGRQRALSNLVAYVDGFPAERRSILAREVVNALGLDWDKIDQSKMFYVMDPNEVRAASAAGMDVQLHTHHHRLPFDDRNATEREIEDNRRALSPLVKGPLAHLAYPKGDYHPRQFGWLSAVAIMTASTCRPGLNYVDTHRLELRRFLDGEDVSDLEFEAELTGMTEIIRRVVRRKRS